MDKLELVFQANNLVKEFKALNIDLDYSINSLEQIETFLSKTIVEGKIQPKSFFAKDTDAKTFALGAYLGEVIRKNSKAVRWNTEGIETPIEILQETPSGAKGMTINKAFKRIYNGVEDNIYFFARVLLKDLFNYGEGIPDDFYDEVDRRIIEAGDSPITIYSTNIDKNEGVVDMIYCENEQWVFSSKEDDIEQMQDGQYTYLFLEEVKAKHPEFADLLNEEDKLRIIRQNDGSYRPQKIHKAPFYDSDTIASFQGNMNLNFIQWIKFNLISVLKPIIAIAAGYILMTKVHWVFGFFFLGGLLYTIWYWFSTKNKFKGGDVNPGKVISLKPTLVAVASNLTKYGGEYPILKIIETTLPKEDLELNKIIPTVALYNDNPHDYPFWSEFHPVPVIHGVSNRSQIDQILSSFSEVDITTIDIYLDEIKSPVAGIYKVDEDNNGWVDYKHVDLSKGVQMEGPQDRG